MGRFFGVVTRKNLSKSGDPSKLLLVCFFLLCVCVRAEKKILEGNASVTPFGGKVPPVARISSSPANVTTIIFSPLTAQ